MHTQISQFCHLCLHQKHFTKVCHDPVLHVHVSLDIFLPLSSLRLLIPPLRLLSAAMWQVAQRRDVLDYEKLDEFVALVTATVPDLLSPQQRGKLLLRLRAKVSQRLFTWDQLSC